MLGATAGDLAHCTSPVDSRCECGAAQARLLSPRISFFPCVAGAKVHATVLEAGESWRQEKKDKSVSRFLKAAFGDVIVNGLGQVTRGSDTAPCPEAPAAGCPRNLPQAASVSLCDTVAVRPVGQLSTWNVTTLTE